jgi:hypothetical protein
VSSPPQRSEPVTRWRLVAIADYPNRLDVELVAGTTAPAVVRAIEDAARRAGVVLRRSSSS